MNEIMFDINEKLKLEIAFPLIEFEGIPIVFICTNNIDVYFCLCTEIRGYQQWIIKKTSFESLEKLIQKEYDLRSYIEESSVVYIAHAEGTIDNINYKEINIHDISKNDMPPEGIYLNFIYEDSFENLKKLKEKISRLIFNNYMSGIDCNKQITKEYLESVVNIKETVFTQFIVNTTFLKKSIFFSHKKDKLYNSKSLLFSLYLSYIDNKINDELDKISIYKALFSNGDNVNIYSEAINVSIINDTDKNIDITKSNISDLVDISDAA